MAKLYEKFIPLPFEVTMSQAYWDVQDKILPGPDEDPLVLLMKVEDGDEEARAKFYEHFVDHHP